MNYEDPESDEYNSYDDYETNEDIDENDPRALIQIGGWVNGERNQYQYFQGKKIKEPIQIMQYQLHSMNLTTPHTCINAVTGKKYIDEHNRPIKNGSKDSPPPNLITGLLRINSFSFRVKGITVASVY